jgi:hypothetical protein
MHTVLDIAAGVVVIGLLIIGVRGIRSGRARWLGRPTQVTVRGVAVAAVVVVALALVLHYA